MMSFPFPRPLLALCLAGACTASLAADAFAPVGAKATLSVEYLYESADKKQDKYDLYEWRVKRGASLVVELVAQSAQAMPTVQAIDASQMAELKGMSGKAQSVHTQMAPMMADVQKIMAKCGGIEALDEACVTRESQKMGAALQGTPQMAAAQNAQKDAQGLLPGAPRYQAWQATAQKGTYMIEETLRFESSYVGEAENLCAKLPRARCTRDETRKGAADVPQPPAAKAKDGLIGGSAVEVDTAKNTLTIMLPTPFPHRLPYTETVKTNYFDLVKHRKGEDDSLMRKLDGTTQNLHTFRVTADGKPYHEKPFTVALKGGWRSQSGEQAVNQKGSLGDGGKLTVRWRFNVQ